MFDETLHVTDAPARVALVPVAVELLGSGPKLHDQIARDVLGLSFTAFFAPEPDERRFIITHDDAGIRTKLLELQKFNCSFRKTTTFTCRYKLMQSNSGTDD